MSEANGSEIVDNLGALDRRLRSGAALAGWQRGSEVYVAVDTTAGETLEIHHVAVQRMSQAGVVPVTWLSLAAQYQGTYTNAEKIQAFMGLMAQHSPTFQMFLQGPAGQQAALAGSASPARNAKVRRLAA